MRYGKGEAMIYETHGRAREYFELAANLYAGCTHACVYCFGSDVLHINPGDYFRRAFPRPNCLESLKADAARLAKRGEKRHILLSFVTDPYQPAEDNYHLTRSAITILHEAGLAVAILTKGGYRATLDFDLLGPDDLFGTTLTFIDPRRSKAWEPGAALPIDRMLSLDAAHGRWIPTWVSLEPVIDAAETLQLIETTARFVDHYKVGTLNYANRLPRDFAQPRTNWKNFARNVQILLDRLGKPYYLKRDLAKYVGEEEGITKGNIPI